MNATDFFTRRIMGMDYRVWGAMLLVCFLGLGMCGYKQIKLSSVKDQLCPTDTIAINGKKVEVVASCYVNRYSPFAVQAEATATVLWDFDDGTAGETGQVVSHKFTDEGTYIVTANVNSRCECKAEVLVVYDPFLPANQEKPLVEIIPEPMHPTIGRPVKFYCASDQSFISSYEWKVLKTKEVKNDAVPIFTFHNEENYTIQLVINGDPSITWTTVIQVTSEEKKPETPYDSGDFGMAGAREKLGKLVPEQASSSNIGNDSQATSNQGTTTVTLAKDPTPKAPEVDPDSFKGLLQDVVDEKEKNLENLYEFLDYKESTMVEVNDSKSLIPLKEFCKGMKDRKKKKRKIESLSFKRDDKKSIQVIRVKIPEKGFWDWVPFVN